MLNVAVPVPEVRLVIFAGCPPIASNVTLCRAVVPCHAHVIVVPEGMLLSVEGANWKSETSTVVMIAAVVVNVSTGAPGNAAAEAVAVCAPNPAPSVRAALALPLTAVVFCGGVIVPPPLNTAQSIVTPPLAFPWLSRLCTVYVTDPDGGAVPPSFNVLTIDTAVPAVAFSEIATGDPTRPVTVAVAD